MNTFVYYQSALLAHFPPEDTKISEELRGAPRESPHNRDFEETVNLIVCDLKARIIGITKITKKYWQKLTFSYMGAELEKGRNLWGSNPKSAETSGNPTPPPFSKISRSAYVLLTQYIST